MHPARNPVNPHTLRQLDRAFHGAKAAAGIGERVCPHGLGHRLATHRLERKLDIPVIQVLLGYKKLNTTARYAPIASIIVPSVKSPPEHRSP